MKLRSLWNVTVLAADEPDPRPGRRQRLDWLSALLEEYSPTLVHDVGYIGARLWVEASDSLAAVADAVASWTFAAERAGIKQATPVRLSVVHEHELRRNPDVSGLPALVGVSEIAQMLSVSKARASELARRAVGFPSPVAELASGPVWTEPSVRAFLADWPRRPGRPRGPAAGIPLHESLEVPISGTTTRAPR
ncbi:MAG: hypothetical protein ACRDPK_10670 [Carbonactinosporaceae bacterium]